MGFMALVIHRRLPRTFFQAAALTNTKWAWRNPPVQIGGRYQSKDAKEDERNKLVHRLSPFAKKSFKYGSKTTPNEPKSKEKIFSYDHLYIGTAKPKRKSIAVRLQSLLNDKSTKLDPSSNTQITQASDTGTDFQFLPFIAFSTPRQVPEGKRRYVDLRLEGRAFQKERPEYQHMCHRSEPAMQTSMEECDCILETVTPQLTASSISQSLEKLSYLPKEKLIAIQSDDRFVNLCRYSVLHLTSFTTSQIICSFSALVRFRIAPCPVLSQYKQEFCCRVEEFSINELLLVADSFRCLNVLFSSFMSPMYRIMQQHLSELTFPQLMQLMYIIEGERSAPKPLMEQIELRVLENITSMGLAEIGLVCLCFFKNQCRLSLQSMEKISNIVVPNIEQVSNYVLVNLLKMFRFTREHDMVFFNQVGKEVSKRVGKMPVQAIMHVLLSFASNRILNEGFLNAVALAITDKLPYCRTKDLAKILWSLSVLGYTPSNASLFYSFFIDEIRSRVREFKSYPEHLLTCILALIFMQQFPQDLICVVLSKNFILHSSKLTAFDLKKDLFAIAASVEIEFPQYTGPTISPEFRKEVSEMLMEQSTEDFRIKREWIEVRKMLLHMLGGRQYVKEHMILPHTRSKDFEVHLDVNRKPVAINPAVNKNPSQICEITPDLLQKLTNTSELMPTNSKSSGVDEPENLNSVEVVSFANCSDEKNENPASQSEVTRLAIQVSNRNQYLANGSLQLLPLHVMKRRQLQKLGYVVVDVPYWEWYPIYKQTNAEKINYLHYKLFSSFKV